MRFQNWFLNPLCLAYIRLFMHPRQARRKKINSIPSRQIRCCIYHLSIMNCEIWIWNMILWTQCGSKIILGSNFIFFLIFWLLVWALNSQIFGKHLKSMKHEKIIGNNTTCKTILQLIFTDLINRWFHGLYINFRNLIESFQLKWKFGETQHMCLKLHTSSLSKNRLFVTNHNSATKMLYLRQKPEIILSINCHDSWQFALSAKS